jgi:hypothetical protein
MKTLFSINEVSDEIKNGKYLLLAGDEELLKQLPNGNWIGGTIPYFMSSEYGGVFDKTRIFMNEVPSFAEQIKICNYDENDLPGIASDEYENGYTVLIIPGLSNLHLTFAQNSMNYKDIFLRPLLGWISGVNLDDLGKIKPKVFNGNNGKLSDNMAIAMHIKLPDNKSAKIDIVNLFTQSDGDIITFPDTGFSVTNCYINGKEYSFYEYILENNIDIKLPLINDSFGALINISFRSIIHNERKVTFYAPVFKDVEYRMANPIENYVREFNDLIVGKLLSPVFTCNCILNYLYGELEGKKTANITGPMTFGEIAYQLLNQTMVYLTIE